MIITEQATEQYLRAQEALRLAEEAAEEAKSLLLEAFGAEGITSLTVSGKSVTLIEAARRNFRMDKCLEALPLSTYLEITKSVVDHKEYDKAKEAGKITDEQEAKFVSATPYTRIVVKEAAAAASVAV
jgi:hypothetical protein